MNNLIENFNFSEFIDDQRFAEINCEQAYCNHYLIF